MKEVERMIDFDSIRAKRKEIERRKRGIEELEGKTKRIESKLEIKGRETETSRQHRKKKLQELAETQKEIKSGREKLKAAERELDEMIEKLAPLLDTVKSWSQRETIRKVYCEGKTLEEAASAIGYGRRQATRLLKAGIDIINSKQE